MDASDSPVDSKSPALIAATSERTDAEDSGAVEAAADAPTDLAPPMDLRTGNDTRGENAVMAESATGGGGGTGGAALAATPPDLPAELEKAEADGEVATADGINTLQEAANNPDEQPAEEKVEPDAAASSGTAAAVAAAAVDSSVEVDPLPASASPEAAEQLPTESEPVDTTLDTAQLAAAAPAAQATGVLVDGSACSAAAKAQDTEAVLTVGAANAAPAAVISEAPAALDTVLAAPAVEVTAVEAPVATVASGARPADLAAADQASALSSPNQLAPPAVESRPAAGSEETAPAAQDVPDHAPSTDHHVSDAMGVGLATMRDRIKTAVERENTLRLESELAAVDRESLVQARTLAEANAEVERRARLAAEAELAQAVAALQAERARARDVVAQLMAEASAAHAAAQAMERQVVALQAELRAEAGRRRALERQLERQVRRAAGPLQALASLASDPRLLHQAAWQPQQQWSAHNSPASAFGENWLAQLPQPQHAAPPAAPHSAVSPTRGGQTPQRVMQGVREWLAGGSAAAARSDPAAAPVVQPPAAQPAQQASPRKQRSPSPTPAARRQTPQPGSGWEYRPAWRSSSPVGSVTSRPAAPSGRGGSEPLQEQCRQPAQAQHTQPDQELDELSGTLGPQPPPPAAQEHFAAPPLPQQYVPAPACYMPGQAGWSYMASPYAGYETLAFPSLAAPAAAGFPVGGSGLPGAYYGGLTSQAAAPYGAGGRRAAQKHVAGAGRPASPGSTAADLAERGPWHVPGLESVARPRSASSRDKARGLAVPPHRMGEAELAAARAEYAAQTRAIKAKRQREMLDNPQF
eukprot:scaffold3.g6282.t1